jgi:hypothetical protein
MLGRCPGKIDHMAGNRSTREIIDGLQERWSSLPSFTGGKGLASNDDRDKSMLELIQIVDQLDKRLRAIENASP